MIRLAVPAAVLACVLAACTPEAPTTTEPAAAPPAPAQAPAPVAAEPTQDRNDSRAHCDKYVAGLFDDLVARRAAGGTEREALADLSARGDFALGYVVDGVFGDRFGPGGSAMARADTLAACRRMAKGGELY